MSSSISLAPALPADLHAIASLENHVFYHTPFSYVAWGATRDSEASVERRARLLGRDLNVDGRSRLIKAVTSKGVVVGAAHWVWYGGEKGDGEEGGGAVDGPEKEVEGTDERFCKEVFGWAEEVMKESCEGGGYAKLTTLVIHPGHQRRGLGSLLLADGLRIIDASRLPCVLGASKEGLNLYRRFGFETVQVKTIDFEEYERGKGRGFEGDEHAVMRRPAAEGRGVSREIV